MGKSRNNPNVVVEAASISVPTSKVAKKEKRGIEGASEERARSKKQKIETEQLDQDKKVTKKKVLIEPPLENKNQDKSSDFKCGFAAVPITVLQMKAETKGKKRVEKATKKHANSKNQIIKLEKVSQSKKMVKKLKKTSTESPGKMKDETRSSDFGVEKPVKSKPKAAIGISKRKADYSDSSSESDSAEEVKKDSTAISFKNMSDFSDSSSESDNDAEDVRNHFSNQKAAASAPKRKSESCNSSFGCFLDVAKKETGHKKVYLPDDGKNNEISKISEKELETSAKRDEESGTKRLFVGNLSSEVMKDDLLEFFKKFGEVTEVRLAIKDDGSFRGFGHVEFVTEAGAHAALRMNGYMLLGRPMIIDLAREMGSNNPHEGKEIRSCRLGAPDPGHSIFVKGFGKSIEEDKIRKLLYEHFGSYGEIIRVSIPQDKKTRRSKGFAYVLFSDQGTASKALELNGTELGDYTLTVQKPTPNSGPNDCSYSGGRGRGGRLADQGWSYDKGVWGCGRGGRRPGASYNKSATMPSKGKNTTFGNYE